MVRPSHSLTTPLARVFGSALMWTSGLQTLLSARHLRSNLYIDSCARFLTTHDAHDRSRVFYDMNALSRVWVACLAFPNCVLTYLSLVQDVVAAEEDGQQRHSVQCKQVDALMSEGVYRINRQIPARPGSRSDRHGQHRAGQQRPRLPAARLQPVRALQKRCDALRQPIFLGLWVWVYL